LPIRASNSRRDSSRSSSLGWWGILYLTILNGAPGKSTPLFSRPYGTWGIFSTAFPAMNRWARFGCPYGTGPAKTSRMHHLINESELVGHQQDLDVLLPGRKRIRGSHGRRGAGAPGLLHARQHQRALD